MNQTVRSAIVTVVTGEAAEKLDYTFSSFARCSPIPLYAIVIGDNLPERRLDGIEYRLVNATGVFSDPLREVYFRRLELIDDIPAELVLVVDSYDVLCLQKLPPFAELLCNAAVAGCAEHPASRYLLGQGYTSTFLNGGVMFWNVPESREIRREIVARGRSRFRSVVDDQHCLNEVVFTRYYERVRILPCQYNFRCFLAPQKMRGWPTVETLDGVVIYHNGRCIPAAKKLGTVKPRADLPPLPNDQGPLAKPQQMWRRLQTRFSRHIIR